MSSSLPRTRGCTTSVNNTKQPGSQEPLAWTIEPAPFERTSSLKHLEVLITFAVSWDGPSKDHNEPTWCIPIVQLTWESKLPVLGFSGTFDNTVHEIFY